jgi:ferredoxin-NADP reductase/Na+-translocating ferredoxin:NAD+ oxidoreductase RnfD subunit
MRRYIDNYLNRTTMYRLVLSALIFLVVLAVPLSALGKLPFSVTDLIYSAITILLVSIVTNKIFSWAFKAPVNTESVYISALILILIITPLTAGDPASYLSFIIFTAALSMASKYFFAVGKKHIFNPVAIAAVIAALTLNQAASWWVGNLYMAPVVLIFGLLIVRKIHRTDLAVSLLITAWLAVIVSNFFSATAISPLTGTYQLLFESPLLFLTFFMLTEPLTTPPYRSQRIIYGAIVGLFFIPTLHFGFIYPTPEIALVLGNIFSFLISPKEKLFLKLQEKTVIAANTLEFSFKPDRNFSFRPGQYLEWTLEHRSPDKRGNRRYFTIASSPTEIDLKLGVKFYPEPSSYKNKLLVLVPGDKIVAAQCAGEFVLPDNKEQKLAFIAGGIGITPFRSMIKYCSDQAEKRDIVLLYSNRQADEIAYKNIFDEAAQTIGLKTRYIITGGKALAPDRQFIPGSLNSARLSAEVPDYQERLFYISGPQSMVESFKKTLADLGVPAKMIKTDFFPGFA